MRYARGDKSAGDQRVVFLQQRGSVFAVAALLLDEDPRIPRGVIFERPYGADYAERYHAMLADKRRGE